jgi:hypothetical protein
MISFRAAWVLGLTGLVIGCSVTPAGTVEVTPGMDFNHARRLLYRAAWDPYDVYQRGLMRGDPEFVGLAKKLRAAGIVEVEGCDAAGAACVFNYRLGSQCVRMTTTQAREIAEMRVTSVSSDCPGTR